MQLTIDDHERPKDFVTESEHKRLLQGAGKLRNAERNQLLVMMLYRHGLRETEAVNLRLQDVQLESARIWIRRVKGGLSTEHPIEGDELRLLRRYLRTRNLNLPWLFVSERGGPMSRHSVIYTIGQAAQKAGLGHITPHMLRHGCGYYLANKGYDLRLIQDYLGHRDPKHTARYTRTASVRFTGLWGNKA